MKESILFCSLMGMTFVLAFGARGQTNFNFDYQTVFDSQADQYLISSVNVQKFSEWQSPPNTYWGPSQNDVEGTLTYEFNFGAPSGQIYLQAALASFNFVWGNENGYAGSGTGQCSLWASVDDSSWQLLLNDPTPQNNVASYLNYDQYLPDSLVGTSTLYLQVDMEVDGDPIPSYSDAQFSRYDTSRPGEVFDISEAPVPEPSTAWLAITGCLGAYVLRKKRKNPLQLPKR